MLSVTHTFSSPWCLSSVCEWRVPECGMGGERRPRPKVCGQRCNHSPSQPSTAHQFLQGQMSNSFPREWVSKGLHNQTPSYLSDLIRPNSCYAPASPDNWKIPKLIRNSLTLLPLAGMTLIKSPSCHVPTHCPRPRSNVTLPLKSSTKPEIRTPVFSGKHRGLNCIIIIWMWLCCPLKILSLVKTGTVSYLHICACAPVPSSGPHTIQSHYIFDEWPCWVSTGGPLPDTNRL